MNRGLLALVTAQFLSAFADNAILFTVIAMVMQSGGRGAWYIPALQSMFLIAFVTLTPWVGSLADRYPKPGVLVVANLIKALGAFAIYLGVDPLAGYAVIGIGAATYSPAKYGIIPELTTSDHLVRANGWVEGSTIAAILFGTVGGAWLADHSIPAALFLVMALFGVSALAMRFLPRLPARGIAAGSPWATLAAWMRGLLGAPKARTILVALSAFWASAATLRVVLVAWAPEVLHLNTATDIASLTLFLAIGIIIGAGLVPRMIPLNRIRRTRFSAYAMGMLFLLLATANTLDAARALLLAAGIAGGIFVVPLNAAIQHIGHATVGSGSAVAVQNFFQNSAILISMGLYTMAAARGVSSVTTLFVLGIAVCVMTVIVSCSLPRQTGPA